ncbi:MAG: SPOR domain-containing protein [Chitinophagaceae bacterium]
MKRLFIAVASIFFCLGTFSAYAQQNNGNAFSFSTKTTNPVSQPSQSSQVIQDPRISLLIQKQIYINSLALHNVPGFRVQVISTINRGKAMETKAKLMQLFPDYQTYLSYQSPYFRVRIGNFRSRNDAEQLQEQLNKYFSNGVFTVRDMIHISADQLMDNNQGNSGNNDDGSNN